tara:strand:+ start:172 stop:981 length:810 start_codon:yes stop_codon:yes gene_type:complete
VLNYYRRMTDHPDEPPPPPDFTPVPLKYYRHDGWTPERQRAFIDALAQCGSVPNAARSVGMAAGRIYQLRHRESAEEFRAAWDDAIKKATGNIHDVLVDHAVNGAPEPVMFGGEQVGEFRRFNYRLMMWLLSHHKPDQFSLGPDNAPALSAQRMKSLKKQWRAEWEAERKQKSEAAMKEYLEAKEKHQQEQEAQQAQLHAKIEQLRQRMIAIYIAKDAATGKPSRRFDPAGASPMELLVYDEVSGGTPGEDGKDLGKEVREEMGFGGSK